MDFSHKKLALLFSSGSFNPPHIGHLSMFELARDYLISHGYYVLGGIMSPVGDDYKKKKPTLTCSRHRIRMVDLSVTDYPFVKCSNWEANQKKWVPAKEALEEHLAALHKIVQDPDLQFKNHPYFPEIVKSLTMEQVTNSTKFKMFLVCGGDLLERISIENENEYIESMMKQFGLIVTDRLGSMPQMCIKNHRILNAYKNNIHVLPETIPAQISSTKIREAVRHNLSVKFFVPDPVIQYISNNNLYF